MTGLGTIINSAAILAGGAVGHFAGKFFREEQQEALTVTCGISVLFIAIAGAMQGMLSIDGKELVSGKSMLVVLCLAIGTIIGELIGIERGFERFGEWLKHKTGNSVSVSGRIGPDLLRGRQSGVGKKGTGSQYAAGGRTGRHCGVSAVVILDNRFSGFGSSGRNYRLTGCGVIIFGRRPSARS